MGQNGELAYEFGTFRMECQKELLRCGEETVHLPPKTYAILLVLVRKSPDVVSKTELLRLAWPGVHVEESAVERQVCDLRKALAAADSTGGPAAYIQTVWKRGYRILPPVRLICEAAPEGVGLWTRLRQTAATLLTAVLFRTARADA